MRLLNSSSDIQSYLEDLSKIHGIDKNIIFNNVSREDIRSLSATTLVKIANNLNVDAICLFNQSLNIEALKNSLGADEKKILLPSDYQNNAYSSTTSLKSIITEFKRFGKYEETLRVLQLDPRVLDTHQPLSILVVQKALDHVKKFITAEDLANMSSRNADAFLTKCNFGRIFHERLRSTKPSEALFENVHHVEKNWDYKIIKSRGRTITIETSQSEEMLDSCHNNYTTEQMNALRFGFFKRVFAHLDRECEVTQITPTLKDGHFKFELTYGRPKLLSSLVKQSDSLLQ